MIEADEVGTEGRERAFQAESWPRCLCSDGPKDKAKSRAAAVILILKDVSIIPLPNLLLKINIFSFILIWNILFAYVYKNSLNILPLSLGFVVPRFSHHLFFSINDIHWKGNPIWFCFYSFAIRCILLCRSETRVTPETFQGRDVSLPDSTVEEEMSRASGSGPIFGRVELGDEHKLLQGKEDSLF